MAVKLRIPDAWEGRVHSADVRGWLQAFFQRPCPLPVDPGAGEARVSLSVPPRAVKVLEGITGDSASAALRRVIAAHSPALPAFRSRMPAAALPGRPLARFVAPVGMKSLLLSEGHRMSVPAHARSFQDPEPYLIWSGNSYQQPVTAGEEFPLPVGSSGDVLPQQDFSMWPVIVFAILAGGALWWLLKQPPAAAVARELPRFVKWIPKGA